jgi:hypothetical protein
VTHLLFAERTQHGLKLWDNWIREVSEPSQVTAVQTTGVRITDFCERRGVGGWTAAICITLAIEYSVRNF